MSNKVHYKLINYKKRSNKTKKSSINLKYVKKMFKKNY